MCEVRREEVEEEEEERREVLRCKISFVIVDICYDE